MRIEEWLADRLNEELHQNNRDNGIKTISGLVEESQKIEKKHLETIKNCEIDKIRMNKSLSDKGKNDKIKKIQDEFSKRIINCGVGRATLYRIKDKKFKNPPQKETVKKLERLFKKRYENPVLSVEGIRRFLSENCRMDLFGSEMSSRHSCQKCGNRFYGQAIKSIEREHYNDFFGNVIKTCPNEVPYGPNMMYQFSIDLSLEKNKGTISQHLSPGFMELYICKNCISNYEFPLQLSKTNKKILEELLAITGSKKEIARFFGCNVSYVYKLFNNQINTLNEKYAKKLYLRDYQSKKKINRALNIDKYKESRWERLPLGLKRELVMAGYDKRDCKLPSGYKNKVELLINFDERYGANIAIFRLEVPKNSPFPYPDGVRVKKKMSIALSLDATHIIFYERNRVHNGRYVIAKLFPLRRSELPLKGNDYQVAELTKRDRHKTANEFIEEKLKDGDPSIALAKLQTQILNSRDNQYRFEEASFNIYEID